MHIRSERGETLLGVLVTLSLAGIVFGAAISSFLSASRHGFDQKIMAATEEQAKVIMDLMSYDIRMMGSGVPLGQTGFLMTDATLGDAPLPILTTSDENTLQFRLNEPGQITVLTASFDPASTTTFSVFDSDNIYPGDFVYISNMSAGGTAALKATVASVSGNSVTIAAGFTTTPSTVFVSGSIVERVAQVTYDSPAGNGGITRDAGIGPVILSPGSSFSVEYLDGSGTAMVLPLTAATIASSLNSIRLTVNVNGRLTLKSGATFSTQLQQVIALRNINIAR